MNKLTLKIKNRTGYKIKHRIPGELEDVLNIEVLKMKEYQADHPTEQEPDYIIAFENAEKPVAQLCEKYLIGKLLNGRCFANSEENPAEKEKVIIYLKEGLQSEAVSAIINLISEISLLIVNSNALYYDGLTYKKKGNILRQPLDAVVFSHEANDGIPSEKINNYAVSRNTRIILINLDNLKFEECTAFIEEEKFMEGDSNGSIEAMPPKIGVYGNDGVWNNGIEKGTEHLHKDEISISSYISRKLRTNPVDIAEKMENLLVLRVEGITADKVGVADTDMVADSKIQVVPAVLEEINQLFPEKVDLCLIHEYSGSRMPVKRTDVAQKNIQNRKLNERMVCLNYYRRILMALQPSSKVIKSIGSTEYYRKRHGKPINYDETKAEFEDEEYLLQRKLYGLLKSCDYENIRIYPELSSYGTKRNEELLIKRILLRYCGWAVGKKEILLKCARPYNVDDVSRIVRLSSDKISILGIEPTDIIALRYKDKVVRARVMPFDINNDWKEIQLTNLVGDDDDKVEVESMVGIPVGIRDELGIPDVNVAVTVERDVEYVFRKNNSIQFLPIVGLVISVLDMCNKFMTDVSSLYQIFIALVLVIIGAPFVFFIMLSGERAKVKSEKSKKDSRKKHEIT